MIVTNESELRSKCKVVEPERGLEIGAKLALELEKSSDGIGLAAPQIGIDGRVFVFIKEDGGLVFAINPTILSREDPFLYAKEGCLSFPGKTIKRIRYNKLVWKDQFRKDAFTLEGRDAVVFDHENDHLDGVLMFDRAEPSKYDKCFCGSEEKYKFCCFKEMNGKTKIHKNESSKDQETNSQDPG